MQRNDVVVSFAAAVIALAALVTSVWQGIETRNHNRQSVQPKLHIDRIEANYTSFESGVVPGFSLINNGIGPAIVRDVRVYVDGSLQPNEYGFNGWKNAIRALTVDEAWVRFYGFNDGDALRDGQARRLLYVVENGALGSAGLNRFSSVLARVRIEIDYESIYGDSDTLVYYDPTR